MATDEKIEQEIQDKGLAAARVTPAQIESVIAETLYFNAGDVCVPGMDHPARLLTICVLVLKNGFTVVGKSACASAANFDWEVGRKVARMDAVNQIWALEGYLLKQRIHEAGKV
jgi:Phage protein (N4 Gp49/phage Sf6 gene 66) family